MGDDEQHPLACRPAGHVVQQPHRGQVGLVDVVDHQQHRPPLRTPAQQPVDGGEQPRPCRLVAVASIAAEPCPQVRAADGGLGTEVTGCPRTAQRRERLEHRCVVPGRLER